LWGETWVTDKATGKVYKVDKETGNLIDQANPNVQLDPKTLKPINGTSDQGSGESTSSEDPSATPETPTENASTNNSGDSESEQQQPTQETPSG